MNKSKSSSEKSTGLSSELCRLGDSASDICRQESPAKKFKSAREEVVEELESEVEAVAAAAEEEAEMAVVVVEESCCFKNVPSGTDTAPAAAAVPPCPASSNLIVLGSSAVGVGVNDEGDRCVGGVSEWPEATGND